MNSTEAVHIHNSRGLRDTAHCGAWSTYLRAGAEGATCTECLAFEADLQAALRALRDALGLAS